MSLSVSELTHGSTPLLLITFTNCCKNHRNGKDTFRRQGEKSYWTLLLCMDGQLSLPRGSFGRYYLINPDFKTVWRAFPLCIPMNPWSFSLRHFYRHWSDYPQSMSFGLRFKYGGWICYLRQAGHEACQSLSRAWFWCSSWCGYPLWFWCSLRVFG